MEPHKEYLVLTNNPSLNDSFDEYFKKAKEFVENNYNNELRKILLTNFDLITKTEFLYEYIWVVHTSGFSAKSVSKFFPKLIIAYEIDNDKQEFTEMFERVKLVCNNTQKSKSILNMIKLISPLSDMEWDVFKKSSLSSPEKLEKLPYIGKITCFHLARNIGIINHVKPDLHLVRMAKHWGFSDCIEMCKSAKSEYPLGIVDLILWYSASTFGTTVIR